MAAIGRHVREHLKGTVQADFSCSILEDALAYVNAVPLSFLRMVQLKRVRHLRHSPAYHMGGKYRALRMM